jgi:hypothetical protein
VSQLNDDPEHWRKRAEEMRMIANAMTGVARAKESILRIAEEYERKARQAEGRLGGRASAASLIEKKMASNPKQPARSDWRAKRTSGRLRDKHSLGSCPGSYHQARTSGAAPQSN